MSNFDNTPPTMGRVSPGRLADDSSLSACGEARREAILADLQRQLQTTVRRERAMRRTVIASGIVGAIGLSVGLAWMALSRPVHVKNSPLADARAGSPGSIPAGPELSTPAAIAEPGTAAMSTGTDRQRVIATIVTDRAELRPCGTGNDGTSPPTRSPISTCVLNDSQLVAALAETGESYGLVRVGDRTMVVKNTP